MPWVPIMAGAWVAALRNDGGFWTRSDIVSETGKRISVRPGIMARGIFYKEINCH
jgi:hypothetical protein